LHKGPKQIVSVLNLKHPPAALPTTYLGQQIHRLQREQLRPNPIDSNIDPTSKVRGVNPAELDLCDRHRNLESISVSEHSL